MRRALLAVALLALLGCADQSNAPQTLQDGKRAIGADWAGARFTAPGSAGCRWRIQLDKTGAVVASGKGPRSHSFTVYSSLAGKAHLFSDRCGPWRQ